MINIRGFRILAAIAAQPVGSECVYSDKKDIVLCLFFAKGVQGRGDQHRRKKRKKQAKSCMKATYYFLSLSRSTFIRQKTHLFTYPLSIILAENKKFFFT